MKKTVSMVFALVLVSALAILAGCSLFFGVSSADAKKNLEAAGYTVTVMDGDTYADSEENKFNVISSDLVEYIHAVKGDDEIYLFYFFSIEIAESNYNFIHFDKLQSGQSNELLYFGTAKALKDCEGKAE